MSAAPLRLSCGFALLILALCAAPVVNGNEQKPESVGPFDTGLVEHNGITLTFLDVEVTDDEGRPVPGLNPDDFEVQINGRLQAVYTWWRS